MILGSSYSVPPTRRLRKGESISKSRRRRGAYFIRLDAGKDSATSSTLDCLACPRELSSSRTRTIAAAGMQISLRSVQSRGA